MSAQTIQIKHYDYDGRSPVADVIDITEHKHRGNPESMEANHKASSRKKNIRRLIYAWFLSCGTDGATAEDALHAFPELRYSTVTARISELRRDGKLRQIGIRLTEYSGSPAAVLVTDLDYPNRQ